MPFNFLLMTGQSALSNFAGDRELLILLKSILPGNYIAVLSHTLSIHILACLSPAITVIRPFISISQLFLSHTTNSPTSSAVISGSCHPAQRLSLC